MSDLLASKPQVKNIFTFNQYSKQRSIFKTKINVQNKDQCSKQRSMFKTKINVQN